MSCPSKYRDFSHKPKVTPEMKNKNYDYVWREVMGNPNLYCWVPVSLKNVKPLDLDIENVNIQDIPPPPDNYEDIVAQLAEEAEDNRSKDVMRKLGYTSDENLIVSVDDPKKYKIVKKFIKDKGLKLYGGAAINYYLPREEKIYNPTDIPDYDFFSPDPWNDAVELADIFYIKGYKYVEARAGIHKGTYKVYVNLWPVADITHMPEKEFEKIKTKTISGIKIVSPYKLLENMYKEFSEPYANPGRWPKVAARQKLLSKWTKPLKKKFKCSKDLFSGGKITIPEQQAQLLELVYLYIQKNKLIFTGDIVYNTYMEVAGADKRVVVSNYRVLSENAHKDIQELFSLLMQKHSDLDITTVHYPARELNNTVYKIFAVIDEKLVEICTINQLNSCTPYQWIFGRYIVSIDYLKYDLYITVVYGDTKQMVNDALCKLQYLTKVQYKYYEDKNIGETDKSPLQRFITKCKGPFSHRLKTEILNRWIERVERAENIIKEWSPTHCIRKCPRDVIPEECKNKAKSTCKYPCFWNKYIGRCTGIPKGIYRPGENDEDLKYGYQE